MLPRFLKRILAIVHFKEICVENVWKRNVLTKLSRNGGRSKNLEGHHSERLSIFALLLSEIGGHVPSMPLRSSACPETKKKFDYQTLISSLEKVQELVEFKE